MDLCRRCHPVDSEHAHRILRAVDILECGGDFTSVLTEIRGT